MHFKPWQNCKCSYVPSSEKCFHKCHQLEIRVHNSKMGCNSKIANLSISGFYAPAVILAAACLPHKISNNRWALWTSLSFWRISPSKSKSLLWRVLILLIDNFKDNLFQDLWLLFPCLGFGSASVVQYMDVRSLGRHLLNPFSSLEWYRIASYISSREPVPAVWEREPRVPQREPSSLCQVGYAD